MTKKNIKNKNLIVLSLTLIIGSNLGAQSLDESLTVEEGPVLETVLDETVEESFETTNENIQSEEVTLDESTLPQYGIAEENIQTEAQELNIAETQCLSQEQIDTMPDDEFAKLEIPVCDEGEVILNCITIEEYEMLPEEDKASIGVPICES